MIIEFKTKNYLSIKDELALSLDAGSSKRLLKNTFPYKRSKLLKSVGIYGANASGKSNIIKSMFFMWQLVKFSHSYNIDTKIPPTQFKLDKKMLTEPSSFEITFVKNNTKYQYGFSCLDSKIIDEYLFYWEETTDKPRKALIFSRKDKKKFKFNIEKSKQEMIASQMNENVLYLSRATALNFERTKDAYDFLVNDLVINYNPEWMNFTVEKIYNNPQIKEKIIDILQKADFGGIVNIELNKEKKPVKGVEFKFEKEGPVIRQLAEEEKDFYDVKFIHKNDVGESISFSMDEESQGTAKALSLLGPIFDILENGKVVVIDELEISLHPNITEFIVRLFHSKQNKNNAQIIFTTHNTNLLGADLLRRDQVYICSKEPNKGTELRSLIEYKLRESADFERAYLTGRVGGIPFIDETVLD